MGEDGRVTGGENWPTPDNSFASPEAALYVMGKSGMAVVVVDVQVEERRADCADVYTTWDAEDWQFLRHR